MGGWLFAAMALTRPPPIRWLRLRQARRCHRGQKVGSGETAASVVNTAIDKQTGLGLGDMK
jgi:hypothetical protein